ncbi:MAG: hypothetical protein AAFW75_26450 [Cyanobacteria bacterium J06636_16]
MAVVQFLPLVDSDDGRQGTSGGCGLRGGIRNWGYCLGRTSIATINVLAWRLSCPTLPTQFALQMPYSQFKTIGQALEAFELDLQEQGFFPEVLPISPSKVLAGYLEDTLPIVSITGSKKA